MGHPPLPPPPQMSNGGSPPAPLPPYLSDPSWWLQFKWSQPPPRAPEWLFDYYERYNPPANVCQPLCDEECWHQRAIREDQKAAGLLPPGTPEGPILHGARARANRAYMDWKAAIDDLWADEYKALLVEQAARARQEEAAHRQRILDEHAVRVRQQEEAARQEAARAAQCLLHKRATLERQGEAARRQRLLDKQSARCRHIAQARQTAATRIIFLWLHRQRIFALLARQTLRQLQREVALMILPVLTVSTSPYQVYGQTEVRTNRASRGDKPKIDALII